MRIMGIDSAMTNSGWQVLEYDPNLLPVPTVPMDVHDKLTRVAGGTITFDETTTPRVERIIQNANEVHRISALYNCEYVVIEAALDKGQNKSPTGLATYTQIVGPWHPSNLQSQAVYIPEYVISINPERLQSLAHRRRSTSGTEVVKKYKALAKNPPPTRVSQHEADAYFLAYYGLRFLQTILLKTWPLQMLFDHEIAIFKNATKVDRKTTVLISNSMEARHMQDWWKHPRPCIQAPSVESPQIEREVELPTELVSTEEHA